MPYCVARALYDAYRFTRRLFLVVSILLCVGSSLRAALAVAIVSVL